jgi:hypothetical protein
MICTLMGGLYRLPLRTVQPALARSFTAASYIFSKLHAVGKSPKRKAGDGFSCTQYDRSMVTESEVAMANLR